MVLISIDTQVARYGKRLLDDFQRRQAGVFQERARRGVSVRASAADRSKPQFGVNHITRSRKDQCGFGIRNNQQCGQCANPSPVPPPNA